MDNFFEILKGAAFVTTDALKRAVSRAQSEGEGARSDAYIKSQLQQAADAIARALAASTATTPVPAKAVPHAAANASAIADEEPPTKHKSGKGANRRSRIAQQGRKRPAMDCWPFSFPDVLKRQFITLHLYSVRKLSGLEREARQSEAFYKANSVQQKAINIQQKTSHLDRLLLLSTPTVYSHCESMSQKGGYSHGIRVQRSATPAS